LDAYGSAPIALLADNWMSFILSAGVTGILMLVLSFYAGLSGVQRRSILRRIQAVITTSASP
jgi:VIT1/CCC1 family predicted Fe2+/Mn2+ transporter